MAQDTVQFQSVGRRKESTARIILTEGDGNITVNKKNFDEYFERETLRIDILRPFKTAKLDGKFDVRANVKGGGLSGQAGAIRLGIARAIAKYDASLIKTLRSDDFLTRDARMKERKKYGQRGARKKFQFTKR